MDHSDFVIGEVFYCNGNTWQCTDCGTRTIVAIRIDSVDTVTIAKDGAKFFKTLDHDEAERQGWFNGPIYAVAETVFDESDIENCSPEPKTISEH